MKKKLSVIICTTLILFAIPIFGDIFLPNGYYEETECGLCGKPLSIYVENLHYGDNMAMRMALPLSMMRDLAVREIVTYFNFPNPTVCSNCNNKYNNELNLLINNFFAQKRSENKELIAKYQQEKHINQLKERKDKIKELQNEIKEMEGKLGIGEHNGALSKP